MTGTTGEEQAPSLLWMRRDLRLGDHPALTAAAERGGPLIACYIWDPVEEELLGAAPRWRLHQSLKSLSSDLQKIGGRLIIRRGDALDVLRSLIAETGAASVHWTRYYEASFIERDKSVKAALREDGVEAESHGGFLLREPFATKTQSGGYFRVYSPFRKAFRSAYEPGELLAAPREWPAPSQWPSSLSLDELDLTADMRRGASILARAQAEQVGEQAAERRLEAFLASDLTGYAKNRDRLDLDATSRLSAPLAFGEMSPRRIWVATQRAAGLEGASQKGAEKFLDEVLWREFAWHLAYHTPRIAAENWREGWDEFPWRSEEEAEDDIWAWRQGRTGVEVVDAAMREIYVTGVMHNRARMIVASYLTKNLLVDWRVGERWFADCLVDFDPASNAMGWQWVAGSGPDAAPFFRIFNPETQAEKFDPDGAYRSRWLPDRRSGEAALDLEDDGDRGKTEAVDGMAFFDACPRSWRLSPSDPHPEQSISLRAGRERALSAYQALRQK